MNVLYIETVKIYNNVNNRNNVWLIVAPNVFCIRRTVVTPNQCCVYVNFLILHAMFLFPFDSFEGPLCSAPANWN
jgi:hypothetical protein